MFVLRSNNAIISITYNVSNILNLHLITVYLYVYSVRVTYSRDYKYLL